MLCGRFGGSATLRACGETSVPGSRFIVGMSSQILDHQGCNKFSVQV